MKTSPVYIVAARRTPQGRFLGSLSGYTSLDLGLCAAKAALEEVDASVVDLTVVGNVLPPVLNVARQIALKAGVPQESPAFSVNMICASGLQAVSQGCDAIRLGHASVVLCGGTESMSNAPHQLNRSRQGNRLGDAKMVDTVLLGLSDPVIGESMTQTAERLALQGSISREAQDWYAFHSHRKAIYWEQQGVFNAEIVRLPELEKDEHPRADTTLEKLLNLKAVIGPEGTVTAGNASGINDGSAMLVLCSEEALRKHGWKPLAKVVACASAGCNPKTMGLGPVYATQKLLKKTGLHLREIDALEINEAFAAQVIACVQQMGIADDDPRLNVHGGAVALGHPIGTSGARLAVHMAHRIASGDVKRGIATLCVGGGMGIAALLESCD